MMRAKKQTRRTLGYTVVEVMMALAVLSIGATGVIALQKTALIGNMRARNLATANYVAQMWIERLRIDGLRWRDIAGTNLTTLANTAYLNVVGNDYPTVGGGENVWFAPDLTNPNALAGWEQGADLRGVDDPTAATQMFCPELRVTQILPSVIRAEVRVYWLRHQGAGQLNAGGDLCPGPDPTHSGDLNDNASRENYHFVYLSTTIRKQPPLEP